MGDATCNHLGCSRQVHCRNLCKRHYEQARTSGQLIVRQHGGHPEERFWSKVDASGPCWEWTDCTNDDGYGIFNPGRRAPHLSKFAHRAAWQILVGEVPEGFELDHLCRNRRCVCPEHLEVVTHHENVRRAGRPRRHYCPAGHRIMVQRFENGHLRCRRCVAAARRADLLLSQPAVRQPATNCKRGHEFTPENTYHQKKSNGRTSRQCRKCKVILQRRYEARQAAAAG